MVDRNARIKFLLTELVEERKKFSNPDIRRGAWHVALDIEKDIRAELARLPGEGGGLWDDDTVQRALASEDPASVLFVSNVTLQAAEGWENEPLPTPVLWQALPDGGGRRPSEALAVGEVTVLSAPGGTGKSYLTLALARAAAVAANSGQPQGYACGLSTRPGGTVVVSYEDSPVRIFHRLSVMRMGGPPGTGCQPGGDWAGQIHLWEDPEPLWVADGSRAGESGPSQSWGALWKQVQSVKPSLVVIDPASVALANLSTSEQVPVKSFLTALSREAEEAGVGVLLVAHDTKAARNEVRAGNAPGAGAVAGSAAWTDAARNVLYLQRLGGRERLLESLKSNYGRDGWGAVLAEAEGKDGLYLGLEASRCLRDEAEVAKLRAELKEGKEGKGGKASRRKGGGGNGQPHTVPQEEKDAV